MTPSKPILIILLLAMVLVVGCAEKELKDESLLGTLQEWNFESYGKCESKLIPGGKFEVYGDSFCKLSCIDMGNLTFYINISEGRAIPASILDIPNCTTVECFGIWEGYGC